MVNGKDDDLIRFLNDTDIPQRQGPSLLAQSDSLCSTVVNNSKGGDLLRFLNDTEMPKDKWPFLLRRGSLCSAVVTGKGGIRIRFLKNAQIPKDKWLIFFGRGSLCSAIERGKEHRLLACLEQSCGAPNEKWHTVLRNDSSAMANGRPVCLFFKFKLTFTFQRCTGSGRSPRSGALVAVKYTFRVTCPGESAAAAAADWDGGGDGLIPWHDVGARCLVFILHLVP